MRGLDGYTALIRACFERSDIVRILVKRPDVDVNLASYYGTTALTFAIRNGNAAAVNELLKHPRKSGSKDFFNGKIDQLGGIKIWIFPDQLQTFIERCIGPQRFLM